jgi:hypothetical protein
MTSLQIGPYTVQLRQGPGHQCPLYCVYLDSVLIGKCISVPDLDVCRWIERQQREQTFYAYSSAKLPGKYGDRTGGARCARNRKLGAPRKAATLREIEKALARG